MEKIRINKYLANLGVASRRKIDSFIDEKRITINGSLAKNGDKIDPNKDIICVDGKPLTLHKPKNIYIALNKPIGVLSAVSDDHGRETVADIVNLPDRLYPVGRLDYMTSGLILLTNDGDLAYRITHPKYHLPKTYLATISQKPSPPQLDLLSTGIPLEDGITSKSDVSFFHTNRGDNIIEITLYEGKNRQIRRMCQAVGLDLIALKRISIGPVKLGNLGDGAWRYLSSEETNKLKSL